MDGREARDVFMHASALAPFTLSQNAQKPGASALSAHKLHTLAHSRFIYRGREPKKKRARVFQADDSQKRQGIQLKKQAERVFRS